MIVKDENSSFVCASLKLKRYRIKIFLNSENTCTENMSEIIAAIQLKPEFEIFQLPGEEYTYGETALEFEYNTKLNLSNYIQNYAKIENAFSIDLSGNDITFQIGLIRKKLWDFDS